MELRIMHEFLVLAQTENYLEASDLLFISQPTLSRHIKSLEDELGTPLFERTTRHVQLNKFGRILLPYATQFVELNNQFTNQLMFEKREKSNHLNISTIPAMDVYGITPILMRFHKEHMDCRVNIIPSYAMSVLEKLRQRDCELAFIREQRERTSDEVVCLPFTTDRVVAVVPRWHPLAEYDTIPLARLKGEEIITLPRDTIICDIIASACLKAGFEPHLVMNDHNIGHLVNNILLGSGVGLLMDKHLNIKSDGVSDLKIIEVTPECRTYLYFCYLRDAELSDNAQAFVEMYKRFMGIE